MKLDNLSQPPPEVLAALAGTTKLYRDPGELDRELLRDLFPELEHSTNPRDHVRRAVALERVRNWRCDWSEELRTLAKVMKAAFQKEIDSLLHVKEAAEVAQARIKDLTADLKACQELRGTYESARVKELEKAHAAAELKLTGKDKELATAATELATQASAIKGLLAQITTHEARAAGYERDIQQLTTACATGAEAARARDAQIAAALGAAMEKIVDRWGAEPGPFIEAIQNDLNIALNLLPKPAEEKI